AYQATKRGLTDLETTMEDTHVWAINADGTGRREIGRGIDNRQGAPEWTSNGAAVLFTVQERGNTRLYRLPLSCGAVTQACQAERIVGETGSVGSISTAKNAIAYAFASPADQAALYVAGRRLTDLNSALLSGKKIAEVESFTFVSNDNKFEVEAFLNKPIGVTDAAKFPLIVNIHGGP